MYCNHLESLNRSDLQALYSYFCKKNPPQEAKRDWLLRALLECTGGDAKVVQKALRNCIKEHFVKFYQFVGKSARRSDLAFGVNEANFDIPPFLHECDVENLPLS